MGSHDKKKKSLRSRVYRLRGDGYLEFWLISEDGRREAIRLHCPETLESTRVAVSHTAGFNRNLEGLR